MLKNTAASNETLVARITADIKQLEEKIEVFAQTATTLSQEKQEKQKTLALLEAEATDITAQSDTLSERAHTLAEQINTLKAGVIEKLNDIASLKSRLSSVEAFKESFAQRREAIRLEKESMGEELAQIEARRTAGAAAVEDAQKRLDDGAKTIASLNEKAAAQTPDAGGVKGRSDCKKCGADA